MTRMQLSSQPAVTSQRPSPTRVFMVRMSSMTFPNTGVYGKNELKTTSNLKTLRVCLCAKFLQSYPLSQWCHPTISSSVIPFSSRLQSSPASGSFLMSQFFAYGQSIGVSASASVFPKNIQDWFPVGWTGLISLQSKGLSRVFSNTTIQKHQFFGAQLSLQSNCNIHTWLLEKSWLWLDGPLLVK